MTPPDPIDVPPAGALPPRRRPGRPPGARTRPRAARVSEAVWVVSGADAPSAILAALACPAETPPSAPRWAARVDGVLLEGTVEAPTLVEALHLFLTRLPPAAARGLSVERLE